MKPGCANCISSHSWESSKKKRQREVAMLYLPRRGAGALISKNRHKTHQTHQTRHCLHAYYARKSALSLDAWMIHGTMKLQNEPKLVEFTHLTFISSGRVKASVFRCGSHSIMTVIFLYSLEENPMSWGAYPTDMFPLSLSFAFIHIWWLLSSSS